MAIRDVKQPDEEREEQLGPVDPEPETADDEGLDEIEEDEQEEEAKEEVS